LCLNMLAVLSMRLRQFTLQVENLSLKEVPGRLASYLLYLAQEQDETTTVSLPISKGQLASLLGTIPETLSRILAKMNNSILIEVSGGKITLLEVSCNHKGTPVKSSSTALTCISLGKQRTQRLGLRLEDLLSRNHERMKTRKIVLKFRAFSISCFRDSLFWGLKRLLLALKVREIRV